MDDSTLPYSKPNVDWSKIEKWDRAYYLHNVQAQDEYAFTPIEAVDGNYLYLPGGGRLLDFQSQLISDSLGHRHPRVHAEIRKAMERYGHIFFGLASDYRARAAKLIIDDILDGQNSWAGRVRILSTGTEAVDCAMAMARLYSGRNLILTQEHSYHGMTIGATQLTGYRGNMSTGQAFDTTVEAPGFPTPGFITIPAPEFPEWSGPGPLPSLAKTEEIIREHGPENIAAVITETMFGAAGYMPHPGYLKGLHDLVRKYDILWVLDDVLCGFGRLGEWFSYQIEEGIAPDLMAVGKGLNGCALPVGAVVASHDIGEFFDRARWFSGSTHDGHPLVCASIVGNLEAMIEDGAIDRVRRLGAYLKDRLDALAATRNSIGRISGRGLYYAVDLVSADGAPIIAEDRATKFTGDLSKHPNSIIGRECAARGVFLSGFVPNTIKVAPPFTITEAEIDTGIEAFDAALQEVEREYH